ncbi:MAG: response regulator [Defluviitaleaceae bacterium]|nr:response regulator [Defluviitaleaceae bacterium]MCL2239832.1 response regulator [Defluviitaleaceae bacterium]
MFVLVVDDAPVNLRIAAGILAQCGVKPICVPGGEIALGRMEAGTPEYSMILMDYMMPEMDGVETLRRIRALGTEYAQEIPVIALSGKEGAEAGGYFTAQGFDGYVAKPLTVDKMRALLTRWAPSQERGSDLHV